MGLQIAVGLSQHGATAHTDCMPIPGLAASRAEVDSAAKTGEKSKEASVSGRQSRKHRGAVGWWCQWSQTALATRDALEPRLGLPASAQRWLRSRGVLAGAAAAFSLRAPVLATQDKLILRLFLQSARF